MTPDAIFALVTLALASTMAVAAMARTFDIHRSVSITGVVFVSVLAAHGATAIPWAAGWLGGQYYAYATPSGRFPWVIGTGILGFAVGACVTANLWSFHLRNAQSEFSRRPLHKGGVGPLFYSLAIVSIMVVSALTLPIAGAALTTLKGQSASEIFQFREGTGETWGILAYPIAIFRGVIGPMFVLISLNLVRTSTGLRAKATASLLLVGLLFALLVTVVATLQRAPVVLLIIFLIAGLALSSNRYPRVDWRVFVLLVGILLIVGTAAYVATYQVSAVDALGFVVDRIFLAPQQAVDAFLHVYPDIIPFNGATGIGLVARVAGVADYQAPALLVGYMSTGSPLVDLDCFWVCDLWADFGYVGVAVGSVLVGALLVMLDRWCLERMRRTAAGSALYAFMLVQAINAANVSIFTMLFSGGFILAPALAWLLDSRWKLASGPTETSRR